MSGRFFLGLTILAATIAIGCGGGSSAHLDVAAGQLVVTPATLDFGKVAVGQTATKTGTLHAGNARITVTSADWSGQGFSLGGITFPLTVAAGQSAPFKVTFTPQKDGISAGQISFLSDASNSPHEEGLNAKATQGSGSTGTGTDTGHRVTLSWEGGKPNTIGYNIYRGIKSKGPYSKISTSPHSKSTFTDSSVQGGQTYFYVTTALNRNGKESRYSNQVQVTIPNS